MIEFVFIISIFMMSSLMNSARAARGSGTARRSYDRG